MKKTNIIIAVVLAVLLVISVAQAFQINDIKQKIAGGTFKVSSTGTSGGSNVPSGLQNLPTMVGGC
ncbi:MAG: hypothetical protein AABY01_00425 [Nanoarchaeota archaeon]